MGSSPTMGRKGCVTQWGKLLVIWLSSSLVPHFFPFLFCLYLPFVLSLILHSFCNRKVNRRKQSACQAQKIRPITVKRGAEYDSNWKAAKRYINFWTTNLRSWIFSFIFFGFLLFCFFLFFLLFFSNFFLLHFLGPNCTCFAHIFYPHTF